MPKPGFDKSLLREYDLRGIVGQSLTIPVAEQLGLAFGTMLRRRNARTAALCRDGRLSSPALAQAFGKGLRKSGIQVFRIGLGPTPMLYFAERHLKADAGVMVTGSHNPSDYNGFKLSIGGASIYGDDIQTLGEIIERGVFAEGNGAMLRRSVMGAYILRLMRDVDLQRPLSIAWDPGNGAACPIVEQLARRIPGRHVVLNGEVDGRFPNHHPDPTLPETLEQLHRAVKENACDLGVAFDGDGDRIGVIDNEGHVLWGDQLMMLWAEEVLQRQPGATIIADVKSSQALFDMIARQGGNPLMWRTGHSLIKAKMRETDAKLAGEMSGHIFFADRYFGYDDALYAAIRLMNVVSRSQRSLADWYRRLPKLVNTPEIRIECEDSAKFAIVDAVRTSLQSEGAEVNGIDGVRVKTPDGWWLLRASNTQNVLVARCEATDNAGLDRLKRSLNDHLLAAGIPAPVLQAELGHQATGASGAAAASPSQEAA